MRGGRSIFEGKISTLRRFKDEVREVEAGTECGIALEDFNDFAEGDMIESYRAGGGQSSRLGGSTICLMPSRRLLAHQRPDPR